MLTRESLSARSSLMHQGAVAPNSEQGRIGGCEKGSRWTSQGKAASWQVQSAWGEQASARGVGKGRHDKGELRLATAEA